MLHLPSSLAAKKKNQKLLHRLLPLLQPRLLPLLHPLQWMQLKTQPLNRLTQRKMQPAKPSMQLKMQQPNRLMQLRTPLVKL